MNLTLSIIIVNYNVRNYLEQCLLSVTSATKNVPSEIIIIDNHSSDSDYKWVPEQFPHIIWHQLSSNIGFSKANNIGIKMAKGDYILFLNPDTLVAEDTFIQTIDFFNTHPDCGALGIHMIDGQGNFLPESKRSIPTPLNSFYKLAGLSSLFPRSRSLGSYALTHLDSNSIYKVPILAGAFLMVKNTLLKKVGGFDEDFFMYGEDIDLSFRLQNQTGYQNYFLGNILLLHFKGESSKQDLQKHYTVFYDAMKIFVRKYYKGFSSWSMRQSLEIAMQLRLLKKPHKQKNQQITSIDQFSCMGDEASKNKLLSILAIKYPNAKYLKFSAENIPTIICIGSNYTYNQAFHWLIENHRPHIFWYNMDSHSIIGSSQKDQTGIVWPL